MTMGRCFYWCPNGCGKTISHELNRQQGLFKCEDCGIEIKSKQEVIKSCK